MKVVVLSDCASWVAEDDVMDQRALSDYNRLKEARDAEIRREYGLAAAERERRAADRNASIEREYAREERAYAQKRAEYEKQAADRNLSIEREYARALSEYETRTADRNASIEREYARERAEYERRAADRNAFIERETRERNLLFRRRLGWWPLWAAALATAAIVAFYLYSAVGSLESLTILYDGALSDRYAFGYVMSAFRYSAWIAASSAVGGVILILAFWVLRLRLLRERSENESPFGNPLAMPQSSRLPLASLCLQIAVLICVNAYIRSVAFAPEYLYGLVGASYVFLGAIVIMFASLFAWAVVPFWMRRSRRSTSSGIPKPSAPSKRKIAERHPKPPIRPNIDEIAKRYPKPPLLPNMDEIAKRYPKPPRPSGLDRRSREARAWRARAERERELDERLDSQLPPDWTAIRGYRGSAGVIDRIIVGPLGVCALAVVHVAGMVSVNGHSWKLLGYDERGFRVEQTKLADKFGRTPSAIVNQSAKHLESLLAKRNLVNRVSRGVILAHEKSRVERILNQPVDFIESLDDLSIDDMFDYRGALAEGAAADEVARRIIEDHEEFNRGDSTGNSQSPLSNSVQPKPSENRGRQIHFPLTGEG